MPTMTFTAGVQYNDWKGTAAADDADKHDLMDWLKAKKLIQEGEFLVGIDVFVGENHGGKHKDPIYGHALFVQKGDFDSVKQMIDAANGPILVRRVNFNMNALEFLGLFKRLSITISRKNMLADLEYVYLDTK